MKSEEEIQRVIDTYVYMSGHDSYTPITRAVAHEKAMILKWVLETLMIVEEEVS